MEIRPSERPDPASPVEEPSAAVANTSEERKTGDSERNTSPKESPLTLAQFENRIAEFRSVIAAEETNKFNFVLQALKGNILPDPLKTALDRVTNRQGESDFQIIALIRILYLGDERDEEVGTAKAQISSALDTFPFWPTGHPAQLCMDKIIFWSENHLFMTLGSCYLFRQYQQDMKPADADAKTQKDILECLNSKLETKLLKIYLRAHCLEVFNGVYEVNSTVYLPYTLSGLLNLYDFAIDEEIKRLAKRIIDRVVHHVFLCTTSNGVSNLCAGGRTFARTRLRTHGHNMNQLMNVILGKSPDGRVPSAITDFILTTTWRPNFDELRQALEFCGTHPAVCLSHPTSITRDIYTKLAEEEDVQVDPAELVPLYWSAGLITNPEFVMDTKRYLEKKRMLKNENLSALATWTPGYLKGKMQHYHTLSTGQTYTGITLNVYKEPAQELVLTSFDAFNPHASSFQQLPWIANISGVGVWTQAGSGTEGFLHFGMTNTHNPLIVQKGSVLVAAHAAPHSLTGWMIMGCIFSSAVRCFFPLQLMDEWCTFRATSDELFASNSFPPAQSPLAMQSDIPKLDQLVQKARVWMAGRRGEAYVGVLCTQKTKMDHRATKDAEMRVTQQAKAVHSPRRICKEYRHAWVVVVGSSGDYSSLQDFVDRRCLAMRIQEINGGSSWIYGEENYEVEVTDPVEGTVKTNVPLPVGRKES